MPLTTVADLLATIRSLRLLEPAQLEKVTSLQAKFPEPQALAKKLVSQGWLTAFQANMLLHGRGKELVLDSYVLMERLGEGGMGEVYKARNWKMNRIVALKVIRKERLKNTNAVKRFLREVQAASQLAHSNIVLAFDAGQANNTHFFAMEYVEGADLARLVKQKGPLPVREACEYIRQAAQGLQHAHERGMVHRDIKPPNLLVSKSESSVKILDMGLARMDDQDETFSTLTQEGSVLGTLDYLSPEQALNAHKADIRSDLYSLGCTFYFVLTGQVPFPGGTATEKLLKHRLEDPTPVEKVRPEVPAQVGAVVRKLMAKRPEDRYQTPAEVVADLTGKVGRQALAAPPGDGPTLADGGRLPTQVRSAATAKSGRKLPWIALGMIVGIGGCIGSVIVCAGIASKAVSTQPGESGSASSGTKRPTAAARPEPRYVKKATREETILAALKSAGLPTLEGKWYAIGYFPLDLKDYPPDTVHPPEKEIELGRSYPGKDGKMISWKEFSFQPGRNVQLDGLMTPFVNLGATSYLYHEFDAIEAMDLSVSVAGEDGLMIWINGERAFHHVGFGPIPANQHTLRLREGKNRLLVKQCNAFSKNTVYLCPQWPAKLEAQVGDNLKRDFPK